MSENFVVFARSNSKNYIFSLKQVENKSISQLIDLLLLDNQIAFKKNEEIIMITTPRYREVLQPTCNPLKTYTNLILSDKPNIYQRPEFYLSICPKTDVKTTFFYLNSTVQDDIHLPPWEVGITVSDYSTQSTDNLCKYLITKFPYETNSSNPKTIIDEKGSKPNAKKAIDMLNEMKTKSYSIKCTLSEGELKKVNYRSQIVVEILKSEEAYIDQLKIINEVIIPQFRSNKIFLEEDFRKFDIITNMIQVHSQFLTDLKSSGSSFNSNLSTIFLNFSDYFKIVKPYIKSLDSIYEMMSRADKGKIDQIVKNEPRLNGVAPMSYFIVPFQRIPKYPLFLKDLIKNTPSCHPDSNFLNLALDSIKTVLSNIEYSKEAAENQGKLYEIFMRISKKVNLLAPTRRLLEQFSVQIKSNGSKGVFYVFNDMVLLTSLGQPSTKKVTDETAVFYSKIDQFNYLDQVLEIDTITFHLPETNSICIVEFMNSSDYEKFIELVEKSRIEQYKELEQNKMFMIKRVSLEHLALHVYGHESVGLCSSNKMFSFGGSGVDGCSINIATFISPKTNSYDVFISNNGPSARSEHAMTTDGSSRVFLFGGQNSGDFFNDLYIGVDKKNNEIEWKKIEWKKTDENPEPCAGHTIVYHNEELFVFGGYQKEKVFNDIYIYSIKLNKWSKPKCDQRTFPCPRYYHSACKCGSNLMAIHGGRNQQVYNDTCFFDLTAKKWICVKINGESFCRYGHKSFYYDGFLIFIGGCDDKKEIIPPTVINATKDKDWSYEDYKMGGNQPSTLFLFGLAYLSGIQFYVMGGIDPFTYESMSNSFYFVQLPSDIADNKTKKGKMIVPQIIEYTEQELNNQQNLNSNKRKNTRSFFNFFKNKNEAVDSNKIIPTSESQDNLSLNENSPKKARKIKTIDIKNKNKGALPPTPNSAPNSNQNIDYDLLFRQINVDPTKLLPFQRKQIELHLRNYFNILTDSNNILMSISNTFYKMKKDKKLPLCDIFVKIYDQNIKKIYMIKINSNTSCDKALMMITDKIKHDPTIQLSATIMKIYPFTPDFFELAIYKVVQKQLSHISVYIV